MQGVLVRAFGQGVIPIIWSSGVSAEGLKLSVLGLGFGVKGSGFRGLGLGPVRC